MQYAIGRNIMKYHRLSHREIEKYEGKKGDKREEAIRWEIQALMKSELSGSAPPLYVRAKNWY